MLRVCSVLFQPNARVHHFSRCYDESWVEKLYRGFARNLTRPFEFVCFVDREREFKEPIRQEVLQHRPVGYGSCIEPFRLGGPMIVVGLDTVIVGNIDHMADYCMNETRLALPRDPYHEDMVCNGVALVTEGHTDVYEAWTGQNDMAWLRLREGVALLDDLFPGEVLSYKAHVKKHGMGNAKIIYFHGNPKMHEIADQEVLAHWT